MTLTPFPLLLRCSKCSGSGFTLDFSLFAALAACLAFLGAAVFCAKNARLTKMLGFLALACCIPAGWYFFSSQPLFALLGALIFIQIGFFLYDLPKTGIPRSALHSKDRCFQSTKNSLLVLIGTSLLSFLVNPQYCIAGDQVLIAIMLISCCFVCKWIIMTLKGIRRIFAVFIMLVVACGSVSIYVFHHRLTAFAMLAAAFLGLRYLSQEHEGMVEYQEQWWEPFLNHPARVLISTFFGLCLFGTLLLQLPWSSSGKSISVIDAAFTSVSAVCVTGLTVLDTAVDFSPLGQGFILLLIQLGGLGIMTITTVALHALGKRLSLRQERLLTTLTETSHQELLYSLVTIVRVTIICELIGATLLTLAWHQTGENWHQSLWQGLFTSISAFCNAGFALKSSNLVFAQHSPLILHIVALLIILGGLAPSTTLLLPRWLRGKRIDLSARIALVTTVALLIIGTVTFLVFEWHHALEGLTWVDKLHNAWFQSVTLRTAGFNSIDINGVLSPTFMVMLLLMFIGGSPGGTAGGVKTTTVGILALTFWTTITGKESIVLQNRRIPQAIINRSITVTFAGGIVWLFVVLALVVTQSIPTHQLLFEATSALGTVGLSQGATSNLDEIGKIIIMLAMFIGRIGPMTLFTLLSADHRTTDSRCPDARITLT